MHIYLYTHTHYMLHSYIMLHPSSELFHSLPPDVWFLRILESPKLNFRTSRPPGLQGSQFFSPGLCVWKPWTRHPTPLTICAWSGQQWLARLRQQTGLATLGVHVQALGHSSHRGDQQWSCKRCLRKIEFFSEVARVPTLTWNLGLGISGVYSK